MPVDRDGTRRLLEELGMKVRTRGDLIRLAKESGRLGIVGPLNAVTLASIVSRHEKISQSRAEAIMDDSRPPDEVLRLSKKARAEIAVIYG